MAADSVLYLSGVHTCVPDAVPFLPELVTATRGSGAPLIVTPRKLGATVDQLFWLIEMNEKFSRRTLTPSVDIFSTNVDGIFAASTPAPATSPKLSNVRAR